jgi:hypothetical protein
MEGAVGADFPSLLPRYPHLEHFSYTRGHVRHKQSLGVPAASHLSSEGDITCGTASPDMIQIPRHTYTSCRGAFAFKGLPPNVC